MCVFVLCTYVGAGAGEVHHAQRALLGDQHGVRPDAQGGEPALHHEDGGLESFIASLLLLQGRHVAQQMGMKS